MRDLFKLLHLENLMKNEKFIMRSLIEFHIFLVILIKLI